MPISGYSASHIRTSSCEDGKLISTAWVREPELNQGAINKGTLSSLVFIYWICRK